MDSERIDCELLIREVERRPCLWDSSDEDYRDSKAKKNAWQEICTLMFDSYEMVTTEDQNTLYQMVTKKWKNIRDCFIKDMKRTPQSCDGTKQKKRKYIYADQLSFLLKQDDNSSSTTITYPTTEELVQVEEEPEVELEEESPVIEQMHKPERQLKKNKTQQSESKLLETKLLEFLGQSEPFDEDKAFFLSLVPTVKSLSVDQKIEFRAEVLQLLKRMRSPKSGRPMECTPPACHSGPAICIHQTGHPCQYTHLPCNSTNHHHSQPPNQPPQLSNMRIKTEEESSNDTDNY